MTTSELCIRRPIMTTLVMSAILLFGLMAYRYLPVSDLPNVDFPTINVSASLPGASPETMASSVAKPLEMQFSSIAGLESMTSSSSLGGTSVTLTFSLERSIDAAAQDVQTAIAKAMRNLPPEMPTPPTFQKVNPADQPVFYLSLSSTTLPLSQVHEYADTMLGQRISMVNGVAQVQIYGAQKYAVRIQLDPQQLAQRGIGLDEVVDAVQRQNVNLPTGILEGNRQTYTIEADGQLLRAAQYDNLVVSERNGAIVRLRDVGRAIDSVENNKAAAWRNQDRALILAISKQPGTNTVEVVDSVRALVSLLRDQLPPSVRLDEMFDRSQTIRESFHDVQITLVLTIALVILVIFLFLRNLSATLIPSLALPLSVMGTFAVMDQMGFSLNNFSLMALTLSVGFVVDDAIVMLENIVRHMEQGLKPFEAAVAGSRQIAFTILSMTLSLAAVFIPVLFMGGIMGRLLHEFAVSIAAAILVSGVVSLTLTPMLCSRFLRHAGAGQRHGRFYTASESVFAGMLASYGWTLRQVLRQKLATVGVAVALLGLTVYLAVYVVPMGFLPNEDIGRLMCRTEGPQDTSFANMVARQQQLTQVIAADPDVVDYFCMVGNGGKNAGMIFANLKPRSERKASAQEIVERIRPKLAQVPGIQAFLQVPPPLNVGGRSANAQYQYTLQAPSTDELYRAAADLELQMRSMAAIQDVSSDLRLSSPQMSLNIDRDAAETLKVSPSQAQDALYTAFGSRQVSTIYAPQNQYQVIMELLPECQLGPENLSQLYVKSRTGKLVPLDALVTQKRDVGPLKVNHSGQLPAVTISFNLKPGVALSEAVAQVQEAARTTLPAGVTASFQGTAQAFQSSMKGLGVLLLMSVLVIYIILGILYESFIHPITILSGLPSAGLGALLTLMVFHVDLNVYAFVGIIMLVGIVKKNAIMMIDFAVEARHQGKTAYDAIYEGCRVRFRPIMMTTMAALMGTLPIALGMGAGAESRRPLGLAVVGGLVVSQLLTLYLTPVVYLLFEAMLHRMRAISPGRTDLSRPSTSETDAADEERDGQTEPEPVVVLAGDEN